MQRSNHAGKLLFTTFIMLAWRNLWRNKKRTIITLSSIAIGFGLTVFSIGLQDSGHSSMVRNAINMGDGHITLQHKDYINSPANYRFIHHGQKLLQKIKDKNLNAKVAPRISLQVLASTANNSVGTLLQGIELHSDPIRSLLEKRIISGRWLTPDTRPAANSSTGKDATDNAIANTANNTANISLVNSPSRISNGLLIGEGMARKLKVKIGSKIIITAGKKGGNSESQLARVQAIFKSGIRELDNFLIISNLEFSRQFLIAEGGTLADKPITRIAIFLSDEEQLKQTKTELFAINQQPEVDVLDWQQMMPALVQYIVVDDVSAYIMQIFILLVILFGIINTVLMSILERTREFGLLRALGLKRNYLILLVFVETLLLSILAVIAGWIIGGSIHWYVATYGIDFSGMIPEGTSFAGTFMDPVIYSELSYSRILQLTSIIFIATLASGIYPAIKAARIQPIEALKTQ